MSSRERDTVTDERTIDDCVDYLMGTMDYASLHVPEETSSPFRFPVPIHETRVQAANSVPLIRGQRSYLSIYSEAPSKPPSTKEKETRRQKTSAQPQVRFLDPPSPSTPQGGTKAALNETPERAQSVSSPCPFRKRTATGESAVSPDNHWRRTIFG
jgi:hypothetical protein